MKKIIVAGSINMDLVVRCHEIPKIGETVPGKEFLTIPGGKGANQAVAIAKLGGDCTFLGKVGKDIFGQKVLASMKESQIKIEKIKEEDCSTGVAIINVDDKGKNNIIYIEGANGKIDGPYIDSVKEVLDGASILVMQNEIPQDAINYLLKLAREKNVKTLLNPAPAREIPEEVISLIDIIVPNEYELERITGVQTQTEEGIKKAAQNLFDLGIKIIIVTLGERGVFLKTDKVEKFFTAYKAEVVDTTAAGDSFIGGFCNKLVENSDLDEAINYGQKTAAIAIGRLGAQTSIPSKEEVENFKIGG